MPNRIVIAGAGFAGVWSALSAKRLISFHGKDEDIEVVVIAPEPSLVLRPRLYEANASGMTHPLGPLFKDAGISFIQGTVETIQTEDQTVKARLVSGSTSTIKYDRLVLAVGSTVSRPGQVTGVTEYTFDIDALDSATKLEAHLQNLASLPSSPGCDTLVVCGGGFTGIELATELPKRFPDAQVVLVENGSEIASGFAPSSRTVIQKALADLNVEVKLGSSVTSIDGDGVTLASGERIETKTPIWTAGVRASPLTNQISGPKDNLSRLHVNENLRVPTSPNVFATGDAACARADTNGHHALMSCQHALVLGRFAGHNAAADLLGDQMIPYSQPAYLCCLDLGGYGAVIATGWEKELKLQGDVAKGVKTLINQQLIYPPQNVEEAMTAAHPIGPDSDQLLDQLLAVVA
ncbi:FAD/NAD(P)-binding domain-containing protein [Aspergillus steynii IBT 23096]|uniref:FAD/NAD(P)-binding domain-containing protein n=1 Tax=Aspergillus steynii IBT 23096 TaxID=1392250 RepID=A0A2I2FVZ7_9EURO|nr:FAD/NAD(P)-binding domain-containing protein [Aspergillus steynii IBT 23096]PLB44819.1 FAD/NAD(P)-binding domain-containing protein [Aspergillus steynii IBT 23096]